MFQSIARAQTKTSIRLHFILVGWFPNGLSDQKLYQEAASQVAPNINIVFLDGNDASLKNEAWASADIFLSLVDNIQETFGLTPLEAMAIASRGVSPKVS